MLRLCRLPLCVLLLALTNGCTRVPRQTASPTPPRSPLLQHPEQTMAAYRACPACRVPSHQSPIDIRTDTLQHSHHRFAFAYASLPNPAVHLGHSLQVDAAQSGGLQFDGVSYELLQFHFHTPSEHRINGRQYPLEMHLVHRRAQATPNDTAKHTVLALLFTPGAANLLLDSLLTPPAASGEGRLHATLHLQLLLQAVLQASPHFYHYAGSLTTAPFTEDVRWIVFRHTPTASAQQLSALTRLEGRNARALQPGQAIRIEEN